MKWKRQNQGVGQPSFLPRLLFLAAFFFGGVCLGQVLAGRVPDATGQELRRYLEGYLALENGGLTSGDLWAALVLYARYPLLAFLLGFASVGVVGVFKGSSWAHAFSPEFVGGIFSAIIYIITLCLVDMFDTIGNLYGTASQADLMDENGDPQNLDKCMACDSIATVSGAVLGTSTCTTFVESAAGVAAGGRTGLGKSGTSHRRRTTGASGIPGRR